MTLSRRTFLASAAALGATLALPKKGIFAGGGNPIVLENQNPGSTGWTSSSHPLSRFTFDGQVVGYPSSPSVNKGEQIDFHVSVNPAQAYTISIYRMGWYQGKGGRLMTTLGPFSGVVQQPGQSVPLTGLMECQWQVGASLIIPLTWTSGVYVASVVNSQGFQASLVFVVRDEARVADFVYQQPVFTTAAYTTFPNDHATGKSLYDAISYGPHTLTGTTRAVRVSLDRPQNSWFVSLYGLSWERHLISWLEREGYDVTYSTDLDTHLRGGQLQNYTGVISPAHAEYWTKEMRDAFEQARDAGTHIAFLSPNTGYWQVRVDPSTAGVPNRVITCYKNSHLDPIVDPTLKTDQFRIIGRPEQALVGVQYGTYNTNDPTHVVPFVAHNTGGWVYKNTGLTEGSHVPHLVGYEVDFFHRDTPAPAHLSYSTLSNSPFRSVNGSTVTAQSSIYQAPSRAWVFASGTMSFSWGLGHPLYAHPGIQQMMRNILGHFLL